MGRVVSLEQERVDRLADVIVGELRSNDNEVVHLTSHISNIDEWRRAARKAGRRLGIQIRTGVSRRGDKVWVIEEP
jgi:hypothetical protein